MGTIFRKTILDVIELILLYNDISKKNNFEFKSIKAYIIDI